MYPVVDATLVAAGASLAVALLSGAWTSRENKKTRKVQQKLSDDQLAEQHKIADKQEAAQKSLAELNSHLTQEARQEERRSEAQIVLNRYREPLLEEANNLGNRIDNIRNRGFLYYFREDRGTLAVLSTLFRVARYFGIREMIYAEVNHLKFTTDEETRDVEQLLSEIEHTFTSDQFDRADPSSPNTSRFMLWIEQQQAIGELSFRRDSSGVPHLTGYATFNENFDARYALWFTDFANDLKSPIASTSKRLATLQSLLAKLVCRLDFEERFINPDPQHPNWITRAVGP